MIKRKDYDSAARDGSVSCYDDLIADFDPDGFQIVEILTTSVVGVDQSCLFKQLT